MTTNRVCEMKGFNGLLRPLSGQGLIIALRWSSIALRNRSSTAPCNLQKKKKGAGEENWLYYCYWQDEMPFWDLNDVLTHSASHASTDSTVSSFQLWIVFLSMSFYCSRLTVSAFGVTVYSNAFFRYLSTPQRTQSLDSRPWLVSGSLTLLQSSSSTAFGW